MFKKRILFAVIAAFYGCQTYRPLDISLEQELENWQNSLVGINSSNDNFTTEDKAKLQQSLTGNGS